MELKEGEEYENRAGHRVVLRRPKYKGGDYHCWNGYYFNPGEERSYASKHLDADGKHIYGNPSYDIIGYFNTPVAKSELVDLVANS